GDPVQGQAVEAQPQQRGGGLGGQATAVIGGIEGVADLTLLVLLAVPEQHAVTHKLPRGPRAGAQVERLARPGARASPCPLRHQRLDLGPVPRLGVQVAVDLREPLVGVHGIDVGAGIRPQQQPFGADRVLGLEHAFPSSGAPPVCQAAAWPSARAAAGGDGQRRGRRRAARIAGSVAAARASRYGAGSGETRLAGGTAAGPRVAAASIPAATSSALSYGATAIFAVTSRLSGPRCMVRRWMTPSPSGPACSAVTIARSTSAPADS